ncbi:MFS transporter [Gaiella sp.]|uniref:MFS transporter n=1 Tax=Gaiella sp. TaxID=2663207 RepID=UPI002E365665|nr:MFS transporter [Gaiella sp.]HEX5585284.1 MFS transporter [Gaiella sp.]
MSETAGTVSAHGQDAPIAGHGFARMFGALRTAPYYRTYWVGNQASLLVMQMQFVAMGYLAFTLTNSAAILGLVNLATGLPQFVVSPVAGVLADRYRKRNLILIVQMVLCLAAVALGVLASLGILQWWHLMVAAFVQGSCFAINMPARQSWIPALVPEAELPNAIALNNAGFNAARIIGPALGGILIAVPGFGANGIFYLSIPAVAWVYYTLLQISIVGEPGTRKRNPFWSEFMIGIRSIIRSEVLAPLFLLALVTLLLGMSYQMLLPAFALGVFHSGSEGLGLMGAMVGAGALAGSLLMAYFARSGSKARIQTVAGTTLGVGLLVYGVLSGLHWFIPALVILFILGAATDFYSTINNTLILLNTERELFGRVMSIYMMTWSLAPLASAPFGTAMDRFGGPLTMIVLGGILTVFFVGMTRFHPSYRRMA